MRILIFLLLFTTSVSAQLISLTDSTKLLPTATITWSAPLSLTDTAQSIKLTMVTYGGTSAYINNNFRLIAMVQGLGTYDADTLTLYTASGTANFATVCTTLTANALMDTWIPTLSGTDSTVVWDLHRTPGWAVRFALKGYSTHRGGNSVLVQKKD